MSNNTVSSNLNILVLGGGGREHALYLAVTKSPRAGQVRVAPGNAGIPPEDRVDLNPLDFEALTNWCRENQVDLVVVGPEAPLVAGVSDALNQAGIACFGPDKFAAGLEGSKQFAKEIMEAAGVPTARGAYFEAGTTAREYLDTATFPLVVKADGLAAGKGVTICQAKDQALEALAAIFDEKQFGETPAAVIEEFLEGEECSLFALCDGTRALTMIPAQDHKAVGEGDTGPNTGGMGAYCPAPVMGPELVERARREIFEPVLKTMREKGHPYKGVLYAGLMITGRGAEATMKVLEFNCRFGDPETQIVLPALESDLVELMWQCARGELATKKLSWATDHYMTVVLAAEGYPGSYPKGLPLKDAPPEAVYNSPAWVVHAGTKQDKDSGQLVSSGGRVLNICGRGGDLREARDNAYQLVDQMMSEGLFCRRDIGHRALK